MEKRLADTGMDVTRLWNPVEASERCMKDGIDAVIASTFSRSYDAVTLCLDLERRSEHPLMAVLYAPQMIEKADMDYLSEVGIHHIIRSADDTGIIGILDSWKHPAHISERKPETKVDIQKLNSISRRINESAMNDLASKAKKLEEILENSSDVIYELDPYGRIILISKAIEKLTGYSREELIGMSAMDVTSPDSLEVVVNHISALLEGEDNPPAVEVGVKTKTGHVIPAEMIVRPIRNEKEVVGILGIGRNVEERKRLEDSLRRAINEKDFYLDLMAHDIQNFNQAIIGYIEIILLNKDLSPEVTRYAHGALRQITEIANLIAHLTRVANIRRIKKEDMKEMDLRKVLLNSITDIQNRSVASAVLMTLDCPPGEYPIRASADINDFLGLIVDSAIRHSLSKTVHLKITVTPHFEEEGKFWIIEISSKDLRLSEPVVSCIMSQDYSGCNTIERPDLQLIVARAIIETQGGSIEVRTGYNGKGDGFVARLKQG